MKLLKLAPLALAGLLALASCDSKDKDDTNLARVRVGLVDAPGDYKAVTLDLKQVQYNTTTTTGEDNWQEMEVVAGKFNLLDYVAGKVAIIAGKDLPAGRFEQLRLVLGPDNSLTLKDGTIVPLKTPSGQQSGLKIQMNTTLEAGYIYNIVLDFDAARSIVARGNGEYNLKPVIRAVTTRASGAISGVVAPAAARPTIMAIRTDGAVADTVVTLPNSNGEFQLSVVPVGTYTVKFDSLDPFQDTEKTGVVVTDSKITNIGTVNLN